MKEKIPTMEGGRMGREGNTVWAWLGKAHWGRSLPPSIQGFEPPSVPRKTLPAPGLPDGDPQSKIQGFCLAGGHAGSGTAPAPSHSLRTSICFWGWRRRLWSLLLQSWLMVAQGCGLFGACPSAGVPAGAWRVSPQTLLFEPLINYEHSLPSKSI